MHTKWQPLLLKIEASVEKEKQQLCANGSKTKETPLGPLLKCLSINIYVIKKDPTHICSVCVAHFSFNKLRITRFSRPSSSKNHLKKNMSLPRQ